jgi:hypothetical protein
MHLLFISKTHRTLYLRVSNLVDKKLQQVSISDPNMNVTKLKLMNNPCLQL